MSQEMHSLASFPEELLVRILSLCVTPPPVLPLRPIWDSIIPPPTPVTFQPTLHNLPPRNRLAPLLVSHQFLRIASPLFYHTLHIQSATQAARVLGTLRQHPSLANAVRKLVFGGIWPDCAPLLMLCERVDDVDISLDSGPDTGASPRPLSRPAGSGTNATSANNRANMGDSDTEVFCDALEQREIVHLTIRKDPSTYLTHPRPQYMLERLAKSVQKWTYLESVHLALRVSSSPNTLPLAQALSTAPRLHSVRAQLPAVWNNILLVVSSNPSLEKVMLYSESMFGIHYKSTLGPAGIKGSSNSTDDNENAILGTGLYMMEAKKHARLSELIKAGTSIIRTRAHTTIATVSSQPATTTPLGASRAKEVAAELLSNRPSSSLHSAMLSSTLDFARGV
ncbi:hypothetical protein HYDPIDRAFT_114775 [Hydnomerulius pinastri MD-312]|uniref:Uncharacterized protein n=1 Tax=Hydnomerulius pinastri MD-312 TaxID=994086 RepID=A0A0C9VVV5_9AGAM|nr:hypothetical protein HYDPIDRAFT_114775 [Hydnomerulius pinastri MD-312]